MSSVRPSAQEIVQRGQAIYEDRIRAYVEPEHLGKYIVIDLVSGEYELDTDHLAASNRAAAKHPDGILFTTRVGRRAGGRIGGHWQVGAA